MARRLYPINQFLDDSGDPINGGLLYTYETGTTNNKTTYQAQSGGSSHANPIVLDSAGRPTSDVIWLDDDLEYTFVLKNSTASTTYFTIDNISGIISPLDSAYETHNLKFQNGRGILDSNGNEVLLISEAASAVNYLQAKNSATGTTVEFNALGDDSNVTMTISSKGSGNIVLDSNSGDVKADNNVLNHAIINNHKQGLVVTVGTDTDHDVDIAAGSAADTTNTVLMALSATLTKQIDASWAAGDDAGGFPTGISLAGTTWYHVFLIKHTNGTVDAGFDSSSTAANLLSDSGYTYYRHIGDVYTDGTLNITGFQRVGDTVYWDNPALDVDISNLSTTPVAYTLLVPPDIQVMANANVYTENATAYTGVYIRPSAVDSEAASETAAPLATIQNTIANEGQFAQIHCLTDTSKQVYAVSEAATTTLRISTLGWRYLT